MRKLTVEQAVRMRRDRGLDLPTEDVEYENEVLAYIAKRQAEIMAIYDELDKQLMKLGGIH